MFSLRSFWKAAVAACIITSSTAADLDPIVIKGSKFFYKTNGTEFFIRGVAYQQDFSSNGTISGGTGYKDPLADVDGCKRDIPLLQQLQTNTIRVYAIDPTKDHAQCMQMLQDAGIYLILDLGEPATSINRDTPEWNTEIAKRYNDVVDSVAQYSNVLGFFAGNEVSNAANNTFASAFVKAAVRDTKAYIAQKKYRTIGVGYATNDDDIRTDLAQYFNCGPQDSAIDFWGYNIYSWCGSKATYESSHYEERTQEFSNFSVPAFFAEYGCITSPPRTFTEVQALYGENMTKVWSGGIVYMYFQETNDYGLVEVSDGGQASKLPDFTALSSQMAKVTPSGVQANSYNPTNSPQACPNVDNSWKATDTLPPSPNNQLCNCMFANLTCVTKPGLSSDDMETSFGFICNPELGGYCDGINANATTGVYGAYSMCNATQRLSFAFNSYYEDQTSSNPQNNNPCNFEGAGVKKQTRSLDGCQALVSQAGPAGTGTVTTAPTPTGGSSSGGAPASSSSSGVASPLSVPLFDFGLLGMMVYVTIAAVAGAGMMIL